MMQVVRTLRTHRLRAAALGAALFGLIGLALAANGPEVVIKKPNRYIGAAKCMNCHQAKAAGDQWTAWQDAKHSKAFEVLASDEAKRVAKELGIDDPQKSDKCLKCHVTGHGLDKELFKKGFKPEHGVQCETCHGPGEEHLRARFRAAAEAPELPEGEVAPYIVVPADEIIVSPAREVCYGCHNEKSPSFKSFCYFERVSKIRHLDPRKPRTKEQRAAMLVCGCGDSCACVHECPDDGCGVPPKD